MMKQLVLVGTLAGVLGAGAAYAQPATAEKPAAKAKPVKHAAGAQSENGHTAPKAQPETAPTPAAPTGDIALGTVRLPKNVKADGKALAAGVYQVRVTGQTAAPDAKGQTATLERWIEFVQKGQVKGREVVSIVPQAETDKVQKDTPPPNNGSKVETLKGGDYVRLWIRKGGNDYLVHFPTA